MICNVCAAELDHPVYESETSLTSLCDVFPQPTRVRTCGNCGHLQTDEIENAAAFYDADYTILTESEEEDQIYEVRDGKKIYRTEHQVDVLRSKLDIAADTRILDYGCAKSSMMRTLKEDEPALGPFLYDVSDRYVPFWENFAEPSNWAVYDVPPSWDSKFDIVTSFFALEHITRPAEIVGQIFQLLRPGGIFYGIVPNVLTNSADLVVIDHVNHFTRSSLDCLLTTAGFEVQDVDAEAHRGAFVFVAKRPTEATDSSWAADPQEVQETACELQSIARFWGNAAARLREAELGTVDGGEVAVYGAGFYGAFIRSCLSRPERIRCFVDQNPFLQGSELGGVPVVPPDDLPRDIRNVFVGLNPGHAKTIMENVPAFSGRDLSYIYI
ncbi:MAG: methyltransferase domain-containing protein [Woeseiaceae bacterium]|nr:methyltransferase domain-containing protein [Woeseiaceae bacterium]